MRRPHHAPRSRRASSRRTRPASTGRSATRSTPADLDQVAARWPRRWPQALRSPPLPSTCRASLPDRPDRGFRPDRRRHGLGRRRRICLWPRGPRFRRHGQAAWARLPQGARRACAWPLLPAGACIRATALGASEYTIQLSGNTSHITSPGRLLPRRNMQVVQPPLPMGETLDPAAIAAAIRAHLVAFDLRGHDCRCGAGAALGGPAGIFAAARLCRRPARRPGCADRRRAAALRHARRRRRDDARAHPCRGTRHRQRHAGDRQRAAPGFRLHRPRQDQAAVAHRAGDDQVAGVQRGSARRPAAPAHHHHDA